MKTGQKVLIIVVVIVVIVIAGYFILRDDKPKEKTENKTDPLAPRIIVITKDNTGARTAVVRGIPSGPVGKWVVIGDTNSAGHCPMGQYKIWDGQKWVCCVSTN